MAVRRLMGVSRSGKQHFLDTMRAAALAAIETSGDPRAAFFAEVTRLAPCLQEICLTPGLLELLWRDYYEPCVRARRGQGAA